MSDRIEPTITVLAGSKVPVPEAVAKPNSIDGQMESVLMAWISPDEAIETGIWECSPGTFIVGQALQPQHDLVFRLQL